MSVYTLVEPEQLDTFLTHYPLGNLVDYQGISAGIENTNYFVTTTTGEFVLTLFEQMTHAEVPYFLELMAFLAEHAVPSAHPLADHEGHYLRTLNARPAALVRRLSGHEVPSPNLAQCHALGAALGHMHTATPSFPLYRANPRGPHWWRLATARVQSELSPDESRLLADELAFQTQHQHLELPRGVIHADLFRDNALFEGDVLSGIIDFYYACDDVLLYDVAITVNDWCSHADGSLDCQRLHALLNAYTAERSFTSLEKEAWPVMLRASALRFWLSRLQDLHYPRPGELTHTKNPDTFRAILEARRALSVDCLLP